MKIQGELRFEIQDGEGYFLYPPERFNPSINALDAMLDRHESDEFVDEIYIAGLNQLIVSEPDFIDGYAHLAFAYYGQEKPQKALEIALEGMAAGNRLIPKGFRGRINWHHLENRPFLRALQGAMLAYVELHRHKDAVKFISKMLAYSPNDNQGVRFLLGSEMLRAGDQARAQAVFSDYANDYPPYFYELALTYIMNDDWGRAATALRQGFYANGYIAEILCGNPDPKPLPIWHGCNYAEPGIASDYVEMYGDLWFQYPERLAFIRWLFNHPKVLIERAEILECMQELQWERDVHKRGLIVDDQQELLNAVGHQISSEIIGKRQDRHGREIYPWMLTAGQSASFS